MNLSMSVTAQCIQEMNSTRGEKLKQRLSLGPLKIGYNNEVVEKQKDVTFVVGKDRFNAHTDVLVKVSPVFRSQFNGLFGKETVIPLEDVTPSAFNMFLKLIYEGTRSVSILLTPKDSLYCMLLANRYLMDGLENFLRTKLLRNVTYQNALGILPYCNLNLDLMELRSKCWSIIERDTAKCLKSQFFMEHVTWDLLCDILENSRITINEFELFEACKKWADDKKTSKLSAKDVLGVAIYKIRFPLMTSGEFAIVKRSNLLNRGEIDDLEKNFRRNKTFSNKLRRHVCDCRKSKVSCRLCSSCKNVSVQGAKVPKTPQTNLRLISSPRLRRFTNFHRSPQQSSTPRTPVRMATRSAVDINGNTLRKAEKPLTLTPTTSAPSSRSKIVAEKNLLNCECFKYRSCPSFPNGTTATILKQLGYN